MYTTNPVAQKNEMKINLKILVLCIVMACSFMTMANTTLTYGASETAGSVTIDGKVVDIGMSKAKMLETFGTQNDMQVSEFGGHWYIYSNNYNHFMMANIDGEKVNAIYASGTFSYASAAPSTTATVYTDKNNNNKAYAVLIKDSKVNVMNNLNKVEGYIESVEKLSMHLANASRAQYGLNAVKWNQKVADVALLHCKDMADNGYFAHESQDGRSPGNRLEENGVNWKGYAENLAGGIPTAISLHDEWMNSAGHRENVLHKNMKEVGVSMYYKEASKYKWYIAELFFLQ